METIYVTIEVRQTCMHCTRRLGEQLVGGQATKQCKGREQRVGAQATKPCRSRRTTGRWTSNQALQGERTTGGCTSNQAMQEAENNWLVDKQPRNARGENNGLVEVDNLLATVQTPVLKCIVSKRWVCVWGREGLATGHTEV